MIRYRAIDVKLCGHGSFLFLKESETSVKLLLHDAGGVKVCLWQKWGGKRVRVRERERERETQKRAARGGGLHARTRTRFVSAFSGAISALLEAVLRPVGVLDSTRSQVPYLAQHPFTRSPVDRYLPQVLLALSGLLDAMRVCACRSSKSSS